ncbi:hypothetical protein P7C70_g2917, partial [Phenoliferia sp. Uapishka_3]
MSSVRERRSETTIDIPMLPIRSSTLGCPAPSGETTSSRLLSTDETENDNRLRKVLQRSQSVPGLSPLGVRAVRYDTVAPANQSAALASTSFDTNSLRTVSDIIPGATIAGGETTSSGNLSFFASIFEDTAVRDNTAVPTNQTTALAPTSFDTSSLRTVSDIIPGANIAHAGLRNPDYTQNSGDSVHEPSASACGSVHSTDTRTESSATSYWEQQIPTIEIPQILTIDQSGNNPKPLVLPSLEIRCMIAARGWVPASPPRLPGDGRHHFEDDEAVKEIYGRDGRHFGELSTRDCLLNLLYDSIQPLTLPRSNEASLASYLGCFVEPSEGSCGPRGWEAGVFEESHVYGFLFLNNKDGLLLEEGWPRCGTPSTDYTRASAVDVFLKLRFPPMIFEITLGAGVPSTVAVLTDNFTVVTHWVAWSEVVLPSRRYTSQAGPVADGSMLHRIRNLNGVLQIVNVNFRVENTYDAPFFTPYPYPDRVIFDDYEASSDDDLDDVNDFIKRNTRTYKVAYDVFKRAMERTALKHDHSVAFRFEDKFGSVFIAPLAAFASLFGESFPYRQLPDIVRLNTPSGAIQGFINNRLAAIIVGALGTAGAAMGLFVAWVQLSMWIHRRQIQEDKKEAVKAFFLRVDGELDTEVNGDIKALWAFQV